MQNYDFHLYYPCVLMLLTSALTLFEYIARGLMIRFGNPLFAFFILFGNVEGGTECSYLLLCI